MARTKTGFLALALLLALAGACSGKPEAMDAQRRITEKGSSDCSLARGAYYFDGQRGEAGISAECGNYKISGDFYCGTDEEGIKNNVYADCLKKSGGLTFSGVVKAAPSSSMEAILEIKNDGAVIITHEDIYNTHKNISYKIGEASKPQ